MKSLKPISYFSALFLTFSLLFISCKSDSTTVDPPDNTTNSPIINILNISTIVIGQKITLLGKYFGSSKGTSTVNMNGIDCSTYDIWNDSLITCTVPTGVTSGKLKVVVGTKTSNEISYIIQQSSSLIPMVLIPKGSFYMGTDDTDDWDNLPKHKITISNDFYMAKYEITQEQWKVVYGNISNPSKYVGTKFPVDQITWFKTLDLCNQLSKIEKLTECYTINGETVTCNWNANGYRLPTEAEWEYACRGGTISDFYGTISEIGWTNSNSKNAPNEVGLKLPNSFGLYDMSGNIYEWCWDYYDSEYYATSPASDPKGPVTGEERILRSGSWIDGDSKAKSITRHSAIPGLYNFNWGVRVVRNK
jgi:formylglycine-generating enzyme required for sulfatase activity